MWSERKLEEFFDTWEQRFTELSRDWQIHTNRRTILVLIFAGVLLTTLYVGAMQPPEDFPLNTLITVSEGTSLSEIAHLLEEQKVVRAAPVLEALVRILGAERGVHAGDYIFRKPESVFAVARAIVQGHFGLEPIRIRIPEGATTSDMSRIFGSQLERFDGERFLEIAGVEEGYLFPDTYYFMPNTTDEQVLATMRQNFDTHLKLIGETVVDFGRPLKDIVVMASLLEREAQTTEDRRKIAGVLWNRLDRGMLLQVDAAFLYSIGRTTFDLTLDDLGDKDDPYNTYVHKGLPPGAIGSPSLESLRAAVTPVEHDYLYYLADEDHVTHYSKTYEEHLRKKRQYLGS